MRIMGGTHTLSTTRQSVFVGKYSQKFTFVILAGKRRKSVVAVFQPAHLQCSARGGRGLQHFKFLFSGIL